MLHMPDLARRAGLLATLAAALAGSTGIMSGCGSGDVAPRFNYTLLDGSNGSSEALRGKVLLINFWATNCPACIAEMPQIVATQRRFGGQGYDTLAVAMSYDPPAYVSNFAHSRQLPFGVVIDNTGAIADAFGDIRFTPTSVLIDKRGAIVKRYVGQPDFTALHALVEKLLAEA